MIKSFFGNYIGKYVDIGCYHPIKYSNTLLLHQSGWKGINIDLNQTSIDLFQVTRKNDKNIMACLSDKREIVTVYMDSQFSALNSVNLDNLKNFQLDKIKKLTIETKIFSDLVKDNFDFLNIDCEGNDYKILKTIDLKKYTPNLINIEPSSHDKDDIYEYLNSNGYKLLTVKTMSHIFVKKKIHD